MNTLGARPEPLPARRRIRLTLFITGAVLVTLAAVMVWRMAYLPARLDTSTSQLSEAGLFRASYTPTPSPIPVNQLHTWTLEVTTPDAQPVEGAQIAVDGEMPDHGHGLATRPEVTQDLGGGRYLVEGMKFQMDGWWVVSFTVTADGQTDTARFNLILK